MYGREEIKAGNSAFLASIASLHHTIEEVWEAGNTVIYKLAVDYHLLDGSTTTLGTVTVVRYAEAGEIESLEVYFGCAPTFGAAH